MQKCGDAKRGFIVLAREVTDATVRYAERFNSMLPHGGCIKQQSRRDALRKEKSRSSGWLGFRHTDRGDRRNDVDYTFANTLGHRK